MVDLEQERRSATGPVEARMRGAVLDVVRHPVAPAPIRLIYNIAARAIGGAMAHDDVVLCDLKSRKRLAYVVLGIRAS